MATSLRDNLTSSYFNAAHKLYSKKARRRIIAYVESYDDVAFWRTLLEEFEDDEHYFQVMLPSATSLAKREENGVDEYAEYKGTGKKPDCLCRQ